jgi:5'-3' exonuclease
MGCEDLHQIVSPEEISFSEFSGKTIAIDSVFWFKRYYNAVTKSRFPQEVRVPVEGYNISQTLSLLVSVPDLLRNNITPVFFFDPIKSHRLPTNGAKIPYLEHSPKSNPVWQFPYLQRSTELVLKYLDISYYEAPRDAEADASNYVKRGEADIVVSHDYDTLLYQAPVTVRKERNSTTWEKISLEKVLEQNKINYRELLDIAILTGTDEVMGPYKNHINEACEKVKRADDLDEFERSKNSVLRAPSGKVSDDPPTFKDLHEIYRNPPVSHSLKHDIYENMDPSMSDMNLNNIRIFLHQFVNLDEKTVNKLLVPIKKEL